MQKEKIRALAVRVAKTHGRDPFSVAERAGIFVGFYPFRRLPGMYGVVAGIPFIALQTGLLPAVARVICAHELGHHFLHRDVAARGFFRESSAIGGAGRLEHEANLFAAEFLLSDEEVLSPLMCGMPPAAVAEELEIPPELLAMKIYAMQKRGADVRAETPPARFLEDIRAAWRPVSP